MLVLRKPPAIPETSHAFYLHTTDSAHALCHIALYPKPRVVYCLFSKREILFCNVGRDADSPCRISADDDGSALLLHRPECVDECELHHSDSAR